MPTVKFEWNLGTLIPLGAMGVAVAVGWGNLTTSVQGIERRMETMETSAASDDIRLRSLESSQSNMTARLEAIGQSLNELKAEQRETNAILREIARPTSKQ